MNYSDTPATSHKLRYAAYEHPQAVTSLWRRRSSSPHGSARSDPNSDRGLERQSSSNEAVEAASLSLAAVSLGKLNLETEAEEPRLKKAGSGSDVRDSFEGEMVMSEVYSYLWLVGCKVGSHITGLSFRDGKQRGRDFYI